MRAGPLVVVGDALLDVDLTGTVERVSPDAPVPVVSDVREHRRAGGAGLAATLAARMSGREVVLVAPLGADESGKALAGLLEAEVGLVRLPLDGRTVRKTRIRAAGQSLVRVDQGDGRMADGAPLGDGVAEALRDAAAVLVADYGRGTTAHEDVRRILAGLPKDVPVVWDPHPRGAPPVRSVRLATPNRSEARAFAGTPEQTRDPLGQAARDAAALVARWGVAGVAVTLGERGALLSVGDDVPYVATAPQVTGPIDPCGAGDCFSAATALALADGALPSEAVTDAVRRAAEFVASGTVPQARPDQAVAAGDPWELIERVRARGGTVVATGGCFDLLHPGHVSLLRQARALGDLLVVCLNSDASVRALKGPDRPVMPEQDRARVLGALDCVDAVLIFAERTPERLLERLRPDLWVKGADYASAELPEARIVRRHGGQVVLLPYLEGRSTSRLVERVRAHAGHARDEGAA
ncbi:D-glycero-beta-D-manno-heptose 1-phosphate adenylyltransferase [Thermomonospora cellulosilytica]|uniref:D-glycero-beta-D-manno-heptose 1-phosphate adenylyltransferase n=1 Tax=Thermomonospora cellulosilytica TaxID=1411118 RepID=A0A7W3N231_9ACTN|nr:D-glycero-beta-D-manno-heptose 1-phosphate adenylyltransferase [Thermomonospora cellulosilytica]MBA9006101.1 rfaE bifunctional protein nucleotidyltransferase chain/domain/rfaE bifunctional protein kinase chain/domain [Thermomonospora cellulosilytica]